MPIHKHIIYIIYKSLLLKRLLRTNIQTIPILIDLHHSRLTSLQLSSNNLIRQSITNLLRYQPIQRTCSEFRIIASFCEPNTNRFVYGKSDATVVESSLEFLETDIDDIAEGFCGESFKDDEFVDSVEEFGGICYFVSIGSIGFWKVDLQLC